MSPSLPWLKPPVYGASSHKEISIKEVNFMITIILQSRHTPLSKKKM
jgi:hypothetical protein